MQITIIGQLNQIPRALAFVIHAARQAGLSEHAIHQCELATDEICTNIIEHGFQPPNPDQRIRITLRPERQRLTFTIQDNGKPFNPLHNPKPNATAPLVERPIGGWGVQFVKESMTDIAYEWQNGYNCLTLTKSD